MTYGYQSFNLSLLSVCLFVVVVVGLLLEEHVALRVVLLLEIGLATIMGYACSLYPYSGALASILIIVIFVIAAVESILLFGFVVLLYKLNQLVDLSKLTFLQM